MKRKMTRLEVVAAGAKWDVREHGIGRLSSHPTELAAIAAARAVSMIHTPCELIIRNGDGTIKSEQTYPRV